MKSAYILLTILVFAFLGCNDEDNPSQAGLSIEERINEAKPITWVTTYSGNDITGQYDSNNGQLKDVYVENGYLVVVHYDTHYFNLSLAKEITIHNHSVYLRY